jgi:chromosome segregation ATPase
MKKITDGLNSELGKIKDEYELAIELDANPELGGIFADMFNIDTSALPHTFEQALEKTQSVVNDALRDLNIAKPFDVMKDDLNDFANAVGQSLDSDAYKGIENAQKYIRNLWKKTTSDTIKDWNTLLEKYGDYQTKMVRIAQETAQEQTNIIRKFGSAEEQSEALDLASKITLSTDPEQVARLQKQLAELLKKVVAKNAASQKIAASVQQAYSKKKSQTEWDAFKDSELYALMFEDMDRVSTRAIQNILEQLDKLKDKVKDDPASMKALMDAYKKGREELESRAPFENIIVALKEMRQASIEAADARKQLDAANKEYENAQSAVNYLQSRGEGGKGSGVDYTERLAKAQERLKKATEAKNNAEIKAANAEIKQINAQNEFQNALNNSATCLENVGGLLKQFADLLGIAEDSEAGEMVNALSQGFTMMATALSTVAAAAALAEMSLGWVAAAAAALAVVVGLVSWLSGNDDKQIEKDIKKSEIAVKRLENSYKNLEKAVEEAFGASEIAAKKAEIANKKLQLAELQRQLQLERSRDSKKRDASKIADLEGQIIDLKNEIKDMKNDVTNSFLGISSVKDAVSSMMDDIVDALRNGEDAMGSFNDSIDDMIANMIKQVFSARILGPMLEKIWDKIDADIQKRGEAYADYYADYQATLDHIDTTTNNTGNGYYFWKDQSGSLWYSNSLRKWQQAMREGAENLTYQQWHDILQGWADWAQEHLEEATTPTMADVRRFGTDLRQVAPELEGYMDELEDILREMGLIKDATSEEALSKLQQGIQGVTEDTAGAIEAYMNIVAQRVFEQNMYLQEIRDHLNNFDLDVQLGTLSQMLLQLQQSYQVQQNIESILTGVLNPSGRAIVVELNS